jgi:folate-binding protein YgfZ
MDHLHLKDKHQELGASFAALNGAEIVADYGNPLGEYAALRESAAVLELSFRGRICVTGADRVRFLHGQVTNEVKALRPGEGCYAALISAKGRMQSDLNIYCLQEELLLDFEPGLTPAISERLEKYIIADDVQLVDVARDYGLLSVQGPRSGQVAVRAGLCAALPEKPHSFVQVSDGELGEAYLVNHPRLRTAGFDLFVPVAAQRVAFDKLNSAAQSIGGLLCGWNAFDIARIEQGVPRFGADIDETNIPLEAGLEKQAISFSKGCYIGQEVISRIRTYSQVAKALRGLRLPANLDALPIKGAKLFHSGKEVGYITSAANSPLLRTNIALGYVRKEVNQVGTELTLKTASADVPVTLVELPFTGEASHQPAVNIQ